MALHDREFLEELYSEHLEEAAFLYETRLNWLPDEEVGWQDLEDIDHRLEAHIDALIVGGKNALQLCNDMLAEADPFTLHIIVRVFCRHQNISLLSALWEQLDFADPEKVAGVADALKWDCPKEWMNSVLKVFSGDKQEMFPILAPSIAYKNRASGQALITALNKASPAYLSGLLECLSRCERNIQQQAIKVVAPLLTTNNDDVFNSAALCLLMLGERRALLSIQQKQIVHPRIIAIAGDVAMSRALLNDAKQNPTKPELIFALGLCGNIEAIPFLLSLLDNDELANDATTALNIISGANLFEDVHVADEVSEEELFEHEIEAFKNGELPKNIDGHPYGAEVQQLSLDKNHWHEWFQKNKGQFTRGLRFRHGKPFSAMALVKSLIDNQTSYALRLATHEELVIRYGLDIQFAADDLAVLQKLQLNNIYEWALKVDERLPQGRWYFDGKDMLPT